MGALLIASGEADAMVVGGAEAAIIPSAVASFGNARALARSYQGDPARASRPYDVERSGFVIGEGAGVLVIEAEEHARARRAAPLARLVGWGMTSDAEHLVRPSSSGRGMARAIELALRRADARPGDIRYINPHATSTPQGDLAEYQALRAALGPALDHALVSATKSMIGHLLGGASAVETVATACSLRDRRVHPSINLDRVDEAFASLQLPRAATDLPAGLALKTSSGFGGHNVALLLGPA
jgi:3-oxoacyl-[acyl-carrier-protein] synthase II